MNQNIVLTEKAIGRHTKRLQKELEKINNHIKLSEAQNMLARILGMKDYHELKNTLNFNLEQPKEAIKVPKTLSDMMKESDQMRYAMDFVEKNMDNFFKNGNIQTIMEYYSSNNQDILNYMKNNAFSLLKTASFNKQDYLCHFILDEKLLDLNNVSYQEIDGWFFMLIHNNLEFFEYVFYDLGIPAKLNNDLAGKLIHRMVGTGNTNSLKKLLKDSRISHQKNFFWNTGAGRIEYDFCALNEACSNGDLKMVKYLIEQENLSPISNGSTVQRACLSGNIKLVKYLIDEIKAPYHYYEENFRVNLPLDIRDKFINSKLDTSTLSSALISGNLELLKYLILEKKMSVSEYNNLLIQTAFVESSAHYLYLLSFSECKIYLSKNAQSVFNDVISKYEKMNDPNRKKNQKIQMNIVKYLYESFSININEIHYKSNNPSLINYLKKNQNKLVN